MREELQRAFLLRRFEQHLGGAAVGVIVLSVAFGLGHVVQGWDAVITTGALGAFWAVLYLRRRSSIAPIVSHAGFNSLEVLRVAIADGSVSLDELSTARAQIAASTARLVRRRRSADGALAGGRLRRRRTAAPRRRV